MSALNRTKACFIEFINVSVFADCAVRVAAFTATIRMLSSKMITAMTINSSTIVKPRSLGPS